MSEVKRWVTPNLLRFEDGVIVERIDGKRFSSGPDAFVNAVLSSDYDALATKVAELEAQVDELTRYKRSIEHWAETGK